jgi:hypothetical protein
MVMQDPLHAGPGCAALHAAQPAYAAPEAALGPWDLRRRPCAGGSAAATPARSTRAASERIVAPASPLGVAVAHALHNGAATAAALRERTLRGAQVRQATIHEVAWRTWAPHLEVAPPGLLYVFAPLPHVSFSHSGRRGSLSVLMPEAGDGSQGLAKKPTPVRHDVHSNERGRTHFVVVPLVQDPWRSGRRTSTWRECSGAHA